MQTPLEAVMQFIQGLNCKEGEVARGGYIGRSLAPHAKIIINWLSEQELSKQQLLSLLQTTRWLNHDSSITLI